MNRLSRAALVLGLLVGLLPFVMGQQGCQTEVIITDTTDGNGDDGGDDGDLTSQEKQAIAAACNAPGTVTQATGVCENATGDISGESGHIVPTGPLSARDVSFGTCPTVTKTGSLTDDELSITIDFGSQPCTALTFEDGTSYICSGAATGTFALLAKTIGLEFASIACNAQMLDGMAALGWDLDTTGVWFDGDWDLTWTIEDYALGTQGTGRAGYEWAPEDGFDVTTIEQFTGDLTDATCVWSIVMANLKISLLKYASFIPYSGYMTLDGPDIRPMTITFSENSPLYGEIIVTVTPGRTMTVNLYELDEWLAMYPIEE